MFKALTLVAAFAGCATLLSAQAIDPDTFKVGYYDYFGGANTIQMTNVGTTAGGNVCADIYVFDAEQELAECCSCFLSPDGLRTINVYTSLLGNTLTGVRPPTGAIKIVSASAVGNPSCGGYPTAPKPVSGIRAWGTHTYDGVLTEISWTRASARPS
jgi:hypothetical protein